MTGPPFRTAPGAGGGALHALPAALGGSKIVDVLTYAGVATLSVGAMAAFVLAMSRRRSIRLQALVVAVVPVVVVTVTVLWSASSMFISAQDVVVLAVAIAGGGGLAVVLAVWLGSAVAGGIGDLTRTLRTLSHARPAEEATIRAGSAELTALARELDSTSRRLHEAQRRAERIERARRELVAWVAHDLRTPLSAVQALSEALMDGMVTDTATLARYHGTIHAETKRLTGLVEDLFELSRIQAGTIRLDKEWLPLHELVRDAVDGTSVAGRSGRVVSKVPADLPPVHVSAPEMGRVLTNLIENALRHTPGGRHVAVEARAEGMGVVICVSDACGGIAAVDLPRVFEPGWRGEPARSTDSGRGGMGLAIAKGLVDAHGGRIEVVNTAEGCRFEVRLPGPSETERASEERPLSNH